VERAVTDLPDRLVELLEHAVRASDPEVALHALTALRAAGVTLDGARAAAKPTLSTTATAANGAGAEDRASAVTRYARAVFGEAMRQAAVQPDRSIGVDDLLRAALHDPEGGACRTLEALGVSPEAVVAGLSR
jgi:ATP-dependent Clp protease ATP-binding subunit ClpA